MNWTTQRVTSNTELKGQCFFNSHRTKYLKWSSNCCGASAASEQQHNQDSREIYKVGRILEFITFYQNALHLTTLFTRVLCGIFYRMEHRQPKLILRTAHKLDCFFHAMHNNDIGTLCIRMHRQHLRVCMEMIQNVPNCHKSERSRNKNDLPYFIVVLVIIWGLPGLVWSYLGEKLRFIFFMFTERL